MKARARHTDPASSQMAAQHIHDSGIAAKQHRQIMMLLGDYIHKKGEHPTRGELAKFHAEQLHQKYASTDAYEAIITGQTQMTKAIAGRRLPELRDNGLVISPQIRRCNVTGRSSQVWKPTAIGMAGYLSLVREQPKP